MLSRTLEAHEILVTNARKAADATDENGDEITNDFLTSEFLPLQERQVRFVAEHLLDVPVVRAGTSIPS